MFALESPIKGILAVTFVALLTVGCAHPIKVSPDMAQIESQFETNQRVDKRVSFVINEEDLKKEVTTPGGGGDSVRYFPYRDIEVGLSRMFEKTFVEASKIKSASDAKPGTDYVIKTKIVTNSSSSGVLTWPPTRFTVDLTCEIRDTAGRLIDNARVIGEGNAETSEIFTQHSLAGKRAMADALVKMRQGLFDLKYLAQASAPLTTVAVKQAPVVSKPTDDVSTPSTSGISKKLKELQDLKNQGLISEQDYNKKKSELLDKI